MTFLPVVARELRVASRRRMTYWSRFFTATISIALGLIVHVNARNAASHELGTALFGVISVAAFIYCLGTGIRSTADCLSEEKRDGTLGLLFLTDLKGYDVVGGKLVATSLNAFYGLMAVFPVLAIPLLLGGVTNGEFWRMALVLVNTFLLSLAVGMFMSSICTSPRMAMAGTLIAMLFLSVGIPLCEGWSYGYRAQKFTEWLEFINPDTSLRFVDDKAYAASKYAFWSSVGLIHGLCWVLLGIASFIVPRSWQDRPVGTQKQLWSARWHRWSFGDPAERLVFRRRLLDINAFYWLAGRARLKPAHVWTALLIIACFWTWGAVDNGTGWLDVTIYFITALVLNTMLKIWITSEAGRRLGEDRKLGALELLLSTPLGVEEILRGQFMALKRQFLGPLVVVLLVESVFLIASLQTNHQDSETVVGTASFGLAMIVMLVVDVITLPVVAMWVSLTTRNPNRTTGIVLRRILMLPWLIFLVVSLFIIPTFFMRNHDPSWKFFLGLYFFAGIITDIVFGMSAWQRLNTEFRTVAAQRFSGQSQSWLRQFFSKEKQVPEPPPATVQ